MEYKFFGDGFVQNYSDSNWNSSPRWITIAWIAAILLAVCLAGCLGVGYTAQGNAEHPSKEVQYFAFVLVGVAAAVGWYACVRTLPGNSAGGASKDDKEQSNKSSTRFWLMTVAYFLAVAASSVRAIFQSQSPRELATGGTLAAAVFAGIAWGCSLGASVSWASFTLPLALWYCYLFLTQSWC
jgi:hypothetical protein